MFPNLRAEMARKNLNMTQLSEITGIPLQRLSVKLSGKRELLMNEAIKIKNALEVDMSLDELFKKEGVS